VHLKVTAVFGGMQVDEYDRPARGSKEKEKKGR
jgi:hypothetical protein